jgi:hypothetical protein
MIKTLVTVSLTLSLLVMSFLFIHIGANNAVKLRYDLTVKPIEMPLVINDPFAHLAHGGAPIEQREEKFRKWLCVSLKIQVTNASGSGTIVFHDSRDGYSYVQSCGHLWNGNMTAEEGKKKEMKCKVIIWYHNMTKLNDTKEYPAEVLYYSNTRGADCSLLRFKPDWEPAFIPVAPADYEFKEGSRLHSCGCDGGRECAHYDVRVLGIRGADLCTTENSPRPGRSGGGLMTDDMYVGICWGTSERSGNGNGFFTPLKVLRDYNHKNSYGWLNEVNSTSLARQIPIVDRNNQQGTYPKDYIPLPNRY